MKAILLKALLPILMDVLGEMLSAQRLKGYADTLFDMVEDFVQDSNTKMDDMIVLPVIKAFRIAFDVPDDDGPR